MKKIIAIILTIFCIYGCSKKLDLKPDSTLVIPKTAKDLTSLLDNSTLLNSTPSLAQLASDEYFIPNVQAFQALEAIPRNSYIWKSDIFEGQTQLRSWLVPYSAIFYCNSVLNVLEKQEIDNDLEMKNIKGWALFTRAYSFYSLASLYAKAYEASTAASDLGIPLKLNANIDEIIPRSSVQETYNRITQDILESIELLNTNITDGKRNRPSKVAAYALLARVYLSMRKYDQAEIYAEKVLTNYSILINYNTLSKTSANAFTLNTAEIIYFTQQILEYSTTTYGINTSYGLDPKIISLYKSNDLRLPIYFTKNSLGNYNFKAINNGQGYPFTGLATDEIYLIKAECLARRQQKDEALSVLNNLIKTRVVTGTFIPVIATTANEALEIVLEERRKALVWRSLRWTDLKRFNLENRNVALTRNLNGTIYTLEPNSLKYILPIPDDEISLTGISQNIR